MFMIIIKYLINSSDEKIDYLQNYDFYAERQNKNSKRLDFIDASQAFC